MSEKEMYFKVQFNDWDSFDQYKKNFIKFFMKDAVVSAGVATTEGGDNFYSYAIDRKQDLNSSYYNSGIHFSNGFVNLPHGLIQSNTEIESMIISKPDNIYNRIADITILPTIDGKINTDSNASLVLPSGQSYEMCNVHSVEEYSLPYRTSSFGIKRGDGEIESVHYKIGMLNITHSTEESISIPQNLAIKVYENNVTEIESDSEELAYTNNYFPIREISKPVIEFSDHISSPDTQIMYLYFELCKDGGGYFDDYCISEDEVKLAAKEDNEWRIVYNTAGIVVTVIQSTTDDYVEGTIIPMV